MSLLLKRSLILTSKLFGPVLILKSIFRRVICKTDSKTITKDPQIVNRLHLSNSMGT